MILLLIVNLQVEHLGSYFIEGAYNSVEIIDTFAFFSTLRGMEIFNFSNPQNPQLISKVATPGDARGIDVVGDFAYIADRQAGLTIFDIADPSNPVWKGRYETGGFVEDVEVRDSLAYLADGAEGLVILNVSDPVHPSYVGSYQSNATAITISVFDTIAYLGVIDDSPAKVINVVDPRNPFLITEYPQNGNGKIGAVYIRDTIAFLSGTWTFPGGVHYNFMLLNIANPLNPEVISGLEYNYFGIRAIVQGNFAYVTLAYGQGLRIIDISNPDSLVETGCFNETSVDGTKSAIKNEILIHPQFFGFSIVDVSNPTKPVRLFYLSNREWNNFVINDSLKRLYLLGTIYYGKPSIRHLFMEFVNISDILNPVSCFQMGFLGGCYSENGPLIVEDYPYLSFGLFRASDFLGIIDVADIYHPQLVKFERGTFCGPAGIDLPFIFAGDLNRLLIGNIYSTPIWIDSISTPSVCYSAMVYDSFAYVACANNLVILNLNMTSPIVTYYHGHYCAGQKGAVLNFPYLYLSYYQPTMNSNTGFLIFDVSNPLSPSVVIDTMMPDPWPAYVGECKIRGCFIVDTLFFLCRAYEGYDIWNIADPAHPTRILNQDTPGYCTYIHVSNDIIYAMDYFSIEVYALTETGIEEQHDNFTHVSPITVFPNPFRQQTEIKLQFMPDRDAKLEIYDILGSLIRKWNNKAKSLPRLIYWDGMDDNGRKLPQGIYFLKLTTNNDAYVVKLVLLK